MYCPIWQCLVCTFTVKGWVLTPKKRVNRDKTDFATKLRMFGPLIIDEGPSLSRTAGPAVPHFMLLCSKINSKKYSKKCSRGHCSKKCSKKYSIKGSSGYCSKKCSKKYSIQKKLLKIVLKKVLKKVIFFKKAQKRTQKSKFTQKSYSKKVIVEKFAQKSTQKSAQKSYFSKKCSKKLGFTQKSWNLKKKKMLQ